MQVLQGLSADLVMQMQHHPTGHSKDGRNIPEATWEPYKKHGRLTMQSNLKEVAAKGVATRERREQG